MLNPIEQKHHSGPNCFGLPSGQEVTQAHPTSKNQQDHEKDLIIRHWRFFTDPPKSSTTSDFFFHSS